MNQHNNPIPTPISFTLPKIGENPNLNEDACRCEPRRGLMAIADGMSNSSHPRQWAKSLAEGFTSCEKERVCEYIAQNWHEWLEPFQGKFYQYYLKILQQPVDTKDLKWNPAKSGIQNRGASATFVGLQIFPIDKETNKGKWQAVALGDSCLFQFRKDSDNYTLIKSFPVEKSEDFSGMTSGFSSVLDCNNKKPLLIEDEYELGDTFLLSTDALSEWIHFQLEKQSVEWQGLLTITNEEQFIQFIEPLRQQHQIKNDDTTYCYYETNFLSEEDAGESSEQHYVAEESKNDGTIKSDISELDDEEPVQQREERAEGDKLGTLHDAICKTQIFSNQVLIDPKSSLVILILINTVCSLVLLVLHFLPFHINCNPIPDSTLNRGNQNFDEVMTPQVEKYLDSEYVSVTESNTKKMGSTEALIGGNLRSNFSLNTGTRLDPTIYRLRSAPSGARASKPAHFLGDKLVSVKQYNQGNVSTNTIQLLPKLVHDFELSNSQIFWVQVPNSAIYTESHVRQFEVKQKHQIWRYKNGALPISEDMAGWLNPGTYNIYSIGLIPSKIVANCVYLTVRLYF
ncbi:hypothetical protein HW132_27920 [Brasilonema sp. CT11]|nr:hypothetical protein [Brasilonema sp. CT11]